MNSIKVHLLTIMVAATVLFAGHSSGWAALPAYLQLEGGVQGVIEGSSTIADREGHIEIFSFGHNLMSPYDAASGGSTGRRQHSPLKILKEIDKSSPKLYQALVANENLTTFTLRFYRMNSSGQELHYFTIRLEDVRIVSITPSFPATFLNQNESSRHMETVAFVYGRIIWRWEEDGIEAEDSWEAQST